MGDNKDVKEDEETKSIRGQEPTVNDPSAEEYKLPKKDKKKIKFQIRSKSAENVFGLSRNINEYEKAQLQASDTEDEIDSDRDCDSELSEDGDIQIIRI